MPNVLVLGSSGYDLSIQLDRLPRPGETLLGGKLHSAPGGKGANQAIAARRAGARVTFLTAFGDDDLGKQAEANCRAEGLDLTHTRIVSGVANQVALILVGEGGQNLIAVAPGASQELHPSDIDAIPASLFVPGSILLASLEVPLNTVVRALSRARNAGMKTIVNPAPAVVDLCDPSILELIDLLTPNEEELSILAPSGRARPMEDVSAWLRQQGPTAVIVTLGERGCLVCESGSTSQVPAPQVRAIDTVGAGDAFSGDWRLASPRGNRSPRPRDGHVRQGPLP